MNGYISVQALIDYANNTIGGIDANDIARFPRADVVERKKGVWLEHEWITCSECGTRYALITNVYPNYCPHCGADMRKGGES